MTTENPYRPPSSPARPERPDDLPGLIRYRVFRGSTFSFVFSATKQMERLRRDAEAFINSEVGPDHVVSIAEHTGLEYSIAVWYRTRSPVSGGPPASARVT